MVRVLRFLLPLVILAAAVLGAGYLRATKPNVDAKPAQERVWTVAAIEVEPSRERPLLRAYGEIVAGREVALRPWVSGRIVEVGSSFVEGGILRQGDLVIAIDPFDYQAAIDEHQARSREARGKLAEIGTDLSAESAMLEQDLKLAALARRNLDRREKLQSTSAGSEKTLDDARMSLSEHENKVISRRQAIARLNARAEQQAAVVSRQEVALRRAKRDLELTSLTAPFDGFVVNTETETAVGKRVGVGDEIARLIDANMLEVRFHLGDRDYASLLAAGGYEGKSAQVVWRVGPERFEFEAIIERVESEIDARSGGVDLYARILDAGSNSMLRPGAFVEVGVPDRTYENVLRLPESTLHQNDTIYVVDNGRLATRTVAVLARDGADVLVRGEVTTKTPIVITRFPEIGPGLRVRVQ